MTYTLNIINAPWAIEPAKLLEIQAIYAGYLRGEQIDIEAIEKRLGRPLVNEPKAYTIESGVAAMNEADDFHSVLDIITARTRQVTPLPIVAEPNGDAA